ncbi:MAG: hypothetical protein KTU85_05370 [Acidimicrobiia bacterium]|nr:hypothetical protein [Acidimicrobiia bacterium]
MIAVKVIARTATVTDIAESRAVGLPPAGNHSVGRAQVLTSQLAAEIGETVTTKITTTTGGTGAPADRRVCGDRPHRESHWRHGQRSRSKGGSSEEATPGGPMGDHTAQGVDNNSAHRFWRALLTRTRACGDTTPSLWCIASSLVAAGVGTGH